MLSDRTPIRSAPADIQAQMSDVPLFTPPVPVTAHSASNAYKQVVSLAASLAGRDPDRALLLLAHQPKGVEEAAAAGVELQISGHTHGGQLFPFDFLAGIAYPYLRGLYRGVGPGASGQIFVSRGTGYWGPPMRLGNPPEIARIVLT
jgi:hypothetical protein